MICPHCGMEIKVEKKKREKPTFPADSAAYRASKYLLDRIRQNDPKFSVSRSDEDIIQSYAVHMDRVFRLDKRTPDEVKRCIDFATSDEFWKKNILSADKLRQQIPRLLISTKEKTTASGASPVYRRLN